MKRRDFLKAGAAAAAGGWVLPGAFAANETEVGGKTYASPRAAMQAGRERLAYVAALRVGTASQQPDFLATVDVDPHSRTYGQIVHRLPMPHVGDELHHYGWNSCSSCQCEPPIQRRYLIVPGFRSGRLHVIDTAEQRTPQMKTVVQAEEIRRKTNLSAPHTVHCLPDGNIMISMLGDRHGEAPGGFLMLDRDFNVRGVWEKGRQGMRFNYDFWYQPRQNVMVSTEWAAPNTFQPGFDLKDVEAGKYGQGLCFWNWEQRRLEQRVDLGETGRIPLEVRFHHDPESHHGFVGAALSSTVWHFHKTGGRWEAEKVISVPPVELEGYPFPVPGLITDLLLSLDDRWLYLSNWLHGELRQYDVSDPAHPKLTGRLWLGGLRGQGGTVGGRSLNGGPQMLQLSLDGKRLYVTNSLYSSWDNQFYPEIAREGSWMLQVDCDTQTGGLRLNEDFFVDFGNDPAGPARAHEVRFPDGDCTSDIWV